MLPSSLNRQSPSLSMHMWTDLLSSCVNVLEPAARKVAWCLSWSLHLYTMYFSSTIIFLNIYYFLFNTNASFSLPSDLSLLLLAIDDPAVRAIHVLACSWSSFWGDWEVLMSTCLWYVFSIFLNQHTSYAHLGTLQFSQWKKFWSVLQSNDKLYFYKSQKTHVPVS